MLGRPCYFFEILKVSTIQLNSKSFALGIELSKFCIKSSNKSKFWFLYFFSRKAAFKWKVVRSEWIILKSSCYFLWNFWLIGPECFALGTELFNFCIKSCQQVKSWFNKSRKSFGPHATFFEIQKSRPFNWILNASLLVLSFPSFAWKVQTKANFDFCTFAVGKLSLGEKLIRSEWNILSRPWYLFEKFKIPTCLIGS